MIEVFFIYTSKIGILIGQIICLTKAQSFLGHNLQQVLQQRKNKNLQHFDIVSIGGRQSLIINATPS